VLVQSHGMGYSMELAGFLSKEIYNYMFLYIFKPAMHPSQEQEVGKSHFVDTMKVIITSETHIP
jgi:hypothetical protein